MKMPCAVVRDLLPLYAEKMAEAETQKLVDEHLEDCAECRRRLAEIDTEIGASVETVKPLMALKKEIRRRRRFSAIVAALLVFVTVYTYSCHDGAMELIPWQDGLMTVEGIEKRPGEAVYGDADLSEKTGSSVEVLVLQVNAAVNGMEESMFTEDDGTKTVVLQGWRSKRNRSQPTADYREMVLCPVPDRLLYSVGSQQQLLWGRPMNGGVEVLPRLALAFYAFVAAGLALVSGAVWFFFRKRDNSWVFRQIFLAPTSYFMSHLLIKGASTVSFFMERDFFNIVVVAVALYALLSLAWPLWLQHRRAV